MTLIPPRLPDYLLEWQDPVGDLVVLNQQGHWEAIVAMVEHLYDLYGVGDHLGVRLHACGTEAGYNRHRRRGEAPCPDCKAGHYVYQLEHRNPDARRAQNRRYKARSRLTGGAE